VKHALRQLRRTPSFTALAVLTLALGIGATTAIFAIVDELNFKPISGTNLDDVYLASVQAAPGRQLSALQKPDFRTLAAYPPPGIAAIAATPPGVQSRIMQIPGRAIHARGRQVSAGYADVFRLQPRQGRWITEEDNAGVNGADVVVISDRIWRDWFNARPDVAGHETVTFVEVVRTPGSSTVSVVRRPFRIVGVAAPGFLADAWHYWVPLGHPPMWTIEETIKCNADRDAAIAKKQGAAECVQPGFDVWMRAAKATQPDRLASAMTGAIAGRPAAPDSPTGIVVLRPATHVLALDRLANTGLLILGFASLVFLAACANLSNMLYARAAEREGEIAVRLSLGATRAGILRLLVSEAALICGAAAALGLGLAAISLQLFRDAFPSLRTDYLRQVQLDVTVDWRAFLFAACTAVVATAIVSATSLWRSSRVTLLSRLAANGPAVVQRAEGRTIRTLLVSVQITAAVLLLIAAGVYLESTNTRLNLRVQYDTSSLVAASFTLPRDYDESRGPHFLDQLLARVRAIDGVTAAGLADALPGGSAPSPSSGPSSLMAEAPERGVSGVPRTLNGSWVEVSPGLIDTLGLTFIRGHDVRETDHAAAPRVTVITQSVADGLWPGDEAIGKGLVCCGDRIPRTVIGIVSSPVTSLEQSPLVTPGNFAFFPAAQNYRRAMMVVARADRPASIVEPMGNAIVALDADVPVFGVAPVDHTQFALVAAERAARTLAASLGAIALGISVLGVYAVVSYFVTKRRREFGLRLALGASRGQVIKLVVDHSIRMVLIGQVPAVLLASWGTWVFQSELVKLKANSLTVWIAVPIVILVAGIVAAYIPARRASRVQPISTLKEL
jgi:predicted permease